MNLFNKKFSVLVLAALTSIQAQAATKYILTVTNGGAMPVSPSAIYVKDGQGSNAQVGQQPTSGFIQLCQTGNPTTRVQELQSDSTVKFVTQTMAPVLPGESKSTEVDVRDPLSDSVHFEAMYGKTKDVCAVGSIGSHSLYALKQHVTAEVFSKDNVVQTGAFLDALLPMGTTYLDVNTCASAATAVACLRELALPNMGKQQIRFFSSYSPSLLMLLETKYGATEIPSLLVPSSGAVQVQLKLKH